MAGSGLPPPPPYFFTVTDSSPRWKLLSLPSLPFPSKSKTTAVIFAKKIRSFRSPKLCLLSKLVPTGRICLTIKETFSWRSLLFYPWCSCLIQKWCCKEEFNAIPTFSSLRIDTGFNVPTTAENNLDTRFKALVAISFKLLYFHFRDKQQTHCFNRYHNAILWSKSLCTCMHVRCIFIVQYVFFHHTIIFINNRIIAAFYRS